MGPGITGFLLALFGAAQGANILLISSAPSWSHSLWCNKLARLLIQNGHKLVVLDTTDEILKNHPLGPNATHYVMDGGMEYEDDLTDLDMCSGNPSAKLGVEMVYKYSEAVCRNMIMSAGTKRFLRDYGSEGRPFDLVIQDGVMCECFLGFVHMFGSPPFIQATAFVDPISFLRFTGQIHNPSYSPHFLLPYVTPMSFTERIHNTILYLYDYFLFHYKSLPAQNRIAKEFFGESLPPVEDIGRNVSLVMVNTHFSMDTPKPLLPGMIHIAGFHVVPPKPLKQEIQSFLDNAEHGAIYFSLGTVIKSSNMLEEKRKMFVEVFRELPQSVIWKWEKDDLPDKPKNVLISKWFSQNDVLAHPKVKLFISHGGLLGTQEAIHHSVPIIGLPFFCDQHSNVRKLEKKGVAIHLDYSKLTKEVLKRSIQTVLTNQSYSKKMKEMSNLFRDTPQTPSERILFWIEYVLRHPDMDHIRSPTLKMPFHEIVMLDIIMFFGILLYVFLFILCTLIKLLYNAFRRNKQKLKDA